MKWKVENVSGVNPSRRFKKDIGHFYQDGARHLIKPGEFVIVSDISGWEGKKFTSHSTNVSDWNRHTCYVVTEVEEKKPEIKVQPVKKAQLPKVVPPPEKVELHEEIIPAEVVKEEPVITEVIIDDTKVVAVEDVWPETLDENIEPVVTLDWLLELNNLSRVIEIKRKHNIKMQGYTTMSMLEKAQFIVDWLAKN